MLMIDRFYRILIHNCPQQNDTDETASRLSIENSNKTQSFREALKTYTHNLKLDEEITPNHVNHYSELVYQRSQKY